MSDFALDQVPPYPPFTPNDPRNYLWRQISYPFPVHRPRYKITSKPEKTAFVASMFTHDNYTYSRHETEVDDVIIEKFDTKQPEILEIYPNFYGHVFKAGVLSQMWVNIHVPMDYIRNTKIYPHIHWTSLGDSAGEVRWVIEYMVAKGWGQSTFSSVSTIVLSETPGQSNRMRHMTSEVSQASAIKSDELEPDSTIKMRIYRDGGADSFGSDVHAWQIDLSYQSENIGTVNRRPKY